MISKIGGEQHNLQGAGGRGEGATLFKMGRVRALNSSVTEAAISSPNSQDRDLSENLSLQRSIKSALRIQLNILNLQSNNRQCSTKRCEKRGLQTFRRYIPLKLST